MTEHDAPVGGSPADGDLPDHELIAGRYRLVQRLGAGSMGVVWRAHDELLGRVVAVKQLLPTAGLAEDELRAATRRAMREARITARLHHPNAVAVHDVVEHNGKPCLVMEYLPARSLASLLVERSALAPAEAAGIGAQVAEALAAAHQAGIVHRDVKPDNVLLAEDGSVRITDFGISRAVGDGSLTGPGIVVGTPAYLAPEVAGGRVADYAADVYSLGSTLYEAVEGEPPFGFDEKENTIALLLLVAQGRYQPPRHAGPLAEVLSWMLDPDPRRRPAMAHIAGALTAVAQGRTPSVPAPTRHLPPVRLPPPGQPEPVRSRGIRPRTLVAGLAGVGLLALGVITGVLINSTDNATTNAAGGPTSATTSNQPATSTTVPTTSTPTDPQVGPPVPGPGGCTAQYAVTNVWPGGFQAQVTVTNSGAGPLHGWTVTWQLPDGQAVNQIWNGRLTRQNGMVTVSNVAYDGDIPGMGSIGFGFLGATPGTNAMAVTRPTVACQGQR
ncbi:MAG TPA: protein kinase [Pseudonocardiaceae bacterium]|nr:protein kinase [Pseudonocardiaceae bacterium]